jgi:hypothetical protein
MREELKARRIKNTSINNNKKKYSGSEKELFVFYRALWVVVV